MDNGFNTTIQDVPSFWDRHYPRVGVVMAAAGLTIALFVVGIQQYMHEWVSSRKVQAASNESLVPQSR